MKRKEEEENWVDICMQDALQSRKEKANLRRLRYSSATVQQRGHDNDDDEDDDYVVDNAIDFSSNDYLGLAHSPEQHALVERMYAQATTTTTTTTTTTSTTTAEAASSSVTAFLGSTGSRLLSGDAPHFHVLEDYLAQVHGRAAALLCNSGYDANLSVVSTLPADVIVYDEYIHNSLHMGMRLWKTSTTTLSAPTSTTASRIPKKEMAPFRHNSVHDLEKVLQKFAGIRSSCIGRSSTTSANRRVVILVESVYSMDGDVAPLTEMLDVAQRYNAIVVVDEAHGLGVFGRKTSSPPTPTPTPCNQQEYNKDDDSSRMLLLLPRSGTGVLAQYELEHHPALLCSIHTFGKAPGCHGAVVCCRNQHVKNYLVNFAYPFIYSTALPLHAIVTIRASYETFTGRRGDELRARLFQLVQLFQGLMRCILLPMAGDATTRSGGGSGDDGSGNKHVFLLPSPSPIQALMISGNACCADFCQRLYQASSQRVLLYPIKSPTVPVGQERVRIILHAHNTIPEVQELCRLIQATLQEMDLLAVTTKRGGTVTIRGDNMGRSKL